MAELWTEFVDPADATGFSREIVEQNEADGNVLAGIFPKIGRASCRERV